MNLEPRKRTHAVTDEAIAERRETIVANAADIISTTGVDRCTFGAVSDATGFSVGMIQHYFRTRERLVLATVEYRTNASVREWQNIHTAGTGALERLYDLLVFAVEGEVSFEQAWGFWIEVYSAAHKDENIRVPVANALLVWRGIFEQTLDEAIEEGLIKPFHEPEVLTTLLLAVVDGLALQTINGIYNHSPAKMIEILRRIAAREFGIAEAEFTSPRDHAPAPAGQH